MIRYALVLSLLAFALGCGQQKPQTDTPANPKAPDRPRIPTTDEEAASMSGVWRVVGIEAAGEKVPDDRVKKLDLTYVFDSGKVTVRRPDRPDNPGTYNVDPSRAPKRIDLFLSGQGITRGVYKMNGNTMRLCLVTDDNYKTYPAVVESTASPKTDVLTLERR